MTKRLWVKPWHWMDVSDAKAKLTKWGTIKI
jgi:hypothetical protein